MYRQYLLCFDWCWKWWRK